MIRSHGSNETGFLLHNLVLFGRLLRRAGVPVVFGQIVDLLKALRYIDIVDARDFRNAARAILVSRPEHVEIFDRAFDLFWRIPRRQEQSLEAGSPLRRGKGLIRKAGIQPAVEDLQRHDESKQSGSEEEQRASWSAREKLRHKDFAELSETELEQVKRLIQAMVWKLERRRTRRKIRSSRGRYLDWRCTFRQNLRHGGDPILLRKRKRKEKRRPLVVLCDISGSMEPYSRLLLQFIYAISNGLEKVEAFVFATRLTRITPSLRERNVDLALRQAGDRVVDWSGGTKIGEALKSFNYKWSRRVLGQGAVVLLISDGWDRGDVELLGREMDRLRKSCRRLIWLNPLLGSPDYQPLTRGIQKALPHIDDFLPVHNLASLSQLGELLEQLSNRTAYRRTGTQFHGRLRCPGKPPLPEAVAGEGAAALRTSASLR